MLTVTLCLLGTVLLLLALTDRTVRRLPLNPALIYLAVGWVAGGLLREGPPGEGTGLLIEHAVPLVVATEFALLVSLFAVGLRLRVPPSWRAWRVAWLLAGPVMAATIALGALAAWALLGLPWGAAVLLAAIVAPTDPVLASDVQIRHDEDRDAVRLSLTAEGGLNDGTALPGVMLGLGMLGLHTLGEHLGNWALRDFIWPIAGGAALGGLLGCAIGWALRRRLQGGDDIARDELLYVGGVALAYGLARATGTSTFIVAFAAGATLLLPLRQAAVQDGAGKLAERLHGFGDRIERLAEATTVLAVGIAMNGLGWSWPVLGFALVFLLLVRPLALLLVVWRRVMPTRQRRLVAWFGIRGIGSLFYLLFALEHGVQGPVAQVLVSATLGCIALSIVLHGVSATPLMAAYQRRRAPKDAPPPD